MGPDLRIRPARPDDLPAVRALLVETWHDTYDALLGAEKVTEITDDWHSISNLQRQLGLPGVSFFVAEEGNSILGHLFAQPQADSVLFLSRLYVLPQEQRRGIGRSLLAAALARHPDVNRVRLFVEGDNAKGLAFYLRESFEAKGESIEGGIRHIAMEKRARV